MRKVIFIVALPSGYTTNTVMVATRWFINNQGRSTALIRITGSLGPMKINNENLLS